MRLTDAVLDEPTARNVDDVLARARDVYDSDAHRADDVIAQQLRRAPSGNQNRRDQFLRERVDLWLRAAEATGDIRRAHFLQTAVEHANESGLRDLRETATQRLQELTLEDLQLQGVSTGLIMRGEDVARFVQPVVDAENWAEALNQFAVLGPPVGRARDNRETVDRHRRDFVFSSLFPVTQYGGDGLPRFSATSDEERAEYALIQRETLNLQFTRRLTAEALLRLSATHGVPANEQLVVLRRRWLCLLRRCGHARPRFPTPVGR